MKFEINEENLTQDDLYIIKKSAQHYDGFADNHIVETINKDRDSLNVIITKDKNLTYRITKLKSKSIVVNSILSIIQFNNTVSTKTQSNNIIKNVVQKSGEKNIIGVFTHNYYQNCYCISLKEEEKWLIINKSKITDIDLISHKDKLIGKKLNPYIKDVDLIAFIKNNIK
ncbi:MAG: hypothetical protein IPN09_02210 [Bacteroidetes bacterium]|nr:hypothetical protein [Bacteroidota bacterium]